MSKKYFFIQKSAKIDLSEAKNERISCIYRTHYRCLQSFHIPTQINDFLSSSWKEKGLQTFKFKEFAKLFCLCISHNKNKDRGRAKQHAL